jgi:tRNA A37 threonylcarbamoyladenosine synthetase subunit TsaC/SUA5/YrdC
MLYEDIFKAKDAPSNTVLMRSVANLASAKRYEGVMLKTNFKAYRSVLPYIFTYTLKAKNHVRESRSHYQTARSHRQ